MVEINLTENCAIFKFVYEIFGDGCLDLSGAEHRLIQESQVKANADVLGILRFWLDYERGAPLNRFVFGQFFHNVAFDKFVDALLKRIQ